MGHRPPFHRTVPAARSLVAYTAVMLLAACTPPVRQYDIKNQKLTCEQGNQYAYKTLRAMGFTVTQFEPAAAGRQGTLRATRQEGGSAQNATVVITCSGTVSLDASEDGRILGQLDLKRAFYMAFTGVAAMEAVNETAAREEAQRPLAAKKEKGLQVLLEPVTGLGSKLDFDLDLAAGGVLPVRILIANATPRTYTFDPDDIVLIQKDGVRVPPISVTTAAQRVTDVLRQMPAGQGALPPDNAEVRRRLEARVLSLHAVTANQTTTGYLFYPLAPYVKGRVSLEDQETEESEGFVVEF
jgi:hypothetical protein